VNSGRALYGAIDLGGTKLLSLVATKDGEVLAEDMRPSHTDDGLDAVLGRMAESLHDALKTAGLSLRDLGVVGVATPGAVHYERGIVSEAPQLPGWQDVPLRDLLRRSLHTEVQVENDATAAAVAEHAFGAGKGVLHMLYLTIGTGIGGGIIIYGRPYRGKSGAAGELGHVVVQADGPPCGCGRRGCLEALASGKAIERKAEELLSAGKSPGLARLVARGERATVELLEQAAREGDKGAARIFAEAGAWLGLALANYANIFDPEVIVIGGGVANAGDLILDPAREALQAQAMRLPLRGLRLKAGELGPRAGALGMVALLRAADV